MLPRLASVVALLAVTSAAGAVDLTKIDRRVGREPAYRTKPKYCLLVLGPEARTRVWLVQDGDTLYVDRNGDGDLTGADEKVAAEKKEDAEEGVYFFKAGELRDGERRHKELTVGVMKIDHLARRDDDVKALLQKDPRIRGYYVSLEVDMPGRKGAAAGGRVQQLASLIDDTGILQFADRPQEAPVIHFGGPWRVSLSGKERLTLNREKDLMLQVGSPGVGPGTFACVAYENLIPEDKYPTVEIVYPPVHPGSPPPRERYELKQRC